MDLEQKDLLESEEPSLVQLKVYCDGSTHPSNPGQGGAGVTMILERGGKTYVKTISKSIPRWMRLTGDHLKFARCNKKKKPVEKNGKYYMETTNNRAEIIAVIEALNRVKDPSNTHITIVCDSQWAINMANGTWAAKENIELVNIARSLVEKFAVCEFKWVRGHAGDKYNEMCDTLAYDAAKNQYPEPVVKTIVE